MDHVFPVSTKLPLVKLSQKRTREYHFFVRNDKFMNISKVY